MVLPQTRGRPLQNVRIFGVQHRAVSDRTKRPWIVRWSVDGRQHSKSFRTRGPANRYRSLLGAAQHHGEPFNPDTGEPESWEATPDEIQVIDWARRWVGEQWPEWQPRTRQTNIIALARFIPLAVRPNAPRPPKDLRSHVVATLEPDSQPDEDSRCEKFLRQWSAALGNLDRSLLADVDLALGSGVDGQPLAASTSNRFRKVSKACIRRAYELELLDRDPWPPQPAGRSQRTAARQNKAIAIRRLPGPSTMELILEAIVTHQPASLTYRTMTAVAYYAGLRPSEVVMLRPQALNLPREGWGSISVTEADVDFDVSGQPKTGDRVVPVPPVLVSILGDWLERGAFEAGELLFRTRTGGRPQQSNWSRALHRATDAVGHERIRVYDCRHAAATAWLQAGVPLGEAARRLGHSVETLVSTYVGALPTDIEVGNRRIEAFLTSEDSQ